jgi:hypothetical protein
VTIYLIPVGADRYELYWEEAAEPADAVGEVRSGLLARLAKHFRTWLARVERERRQDSAGAAPSNTRPGLFRRLKDRALAKIAETIAEQRVLWHLRHESEAHAMFPDDLSESQAAAVIQRMLERDRARHRWWVAVYAGSFALSGLLAVLPGPNVLAYYLAFRLVGHYLSMKGARRGLSEDRKSVV